MNSLTKSSRVKKRTAEANFAQGTVWRQVNLGNKEGKVGKIAKNLSTGGRFSQFPCFFYCLRVIWQVLERAGRVPEYLDQQVPNYQDLGWVVRELEFQGPVAVPGDFARQAE